MRLKVLVVALSVTTASCGGTGAVTTTTTAPPPTISQPSVPATTPTTAVVEIEPETGPLVVWVGSTDVADAVNAQADAFTAATGIDVFVMTIFSAPDDDRGLLDAVLEGGLELLDPDDAIEGVTDRAPDIFIGPHTWLPEFAAAGLAEPVDLAEGLPAGAVRAVTLRGFTIGVPVALDAIVQYRNPSLMPVAPADVSDLECPAEPACLLLPADGDPDVHYPFLAVLGGYVFGDDAVFGFAADDVGVDTTEAIAATVILQGLIEGGAVDGAADRDDARSRFADGEAALIWDGAAMLEEFESVVVEPLPTIGLEPAPSPVRVTTAWVNAAGSHKTEAVEFALRYLGSVEGSTAIARALRLAPVWADQATDAERLIIDAADAGAAVPYIREAMVAWEALANAFHRIHEGVSAGTALTDAADTIRFQP